LRGNPFHPEWPPGFLGVSAAGCRADARNPAQPTKRNEDSDAKVLKIMRTIFDGSDENNFKRNSQATVLNS
jgi:hypothetical protein